MLSLHRRRSARKTTPARITAAALIGSAATVATLVATDIVPVPSWALPGVDVASHQHPGGVSAIDWQAVAASGQKFAFIKATEATGYVNPFFSTDSFKAQEAGIMPGSYHYAKPSIGSARAQARYYAATLATGPQPSLPPVLDLEESGGLTVAQLQQWVREFVDEIRAQTGRDPIMYTYYSFWIDKMGDTTEFSHLPLWLAYFSDTLPDYIPGGWDEPTFWQYSDSGSVDGIQTKVDLNEYNGDDAQLQALAKSSPSGTMVGDVAHDLAPVREATGEEAQVANKIEQATGVDIPLTNDFLMLLLGVAGGRIPPEALIDQGAKELEKQARDIDTDELAAQGAEMAENAQTAGGEAQAAQAKNKTASGATGAAGAETGAKAASPHASANAQKESRSHTKKADNSRAILSALTALSGALKDINANGKEIPVDALLAVVQKSPNGIKVGDLLKLLQTFEESQDWNAMLSNGQVEANPNALQNLAQIATQVKVAPAGTPLPPEAVQRAISAAAAH
ncbi:glycoside hydrolase family 25 protein [Corynebacterium anserum]|uniref:Lysozyme n=1 Tax=Corynebacterium anserum TaxID=2684406 RepID=A0A7G7YLJ7_9CORY|nr:GH25 family lysozyme [Corynebacterium anserum]MBC2682598.1 lysozyme [Corynebacterium anserum]QNH95367.1 lysozyme [Corynebacterium anserum]